MSSVKPGSRWSEEHPIQLEHIAFTARAFDLMFLWLARTGFLSDVSSRAGKRKGSRPIVESESVSTPLEGSLEVIWHPQSVSGWPPLLSGIKFRWRL